MKPPFGILIVGVGGQGVLLASELLCEVALEAGLDAKKSEVHGMAQRGGVVSSHVRLGVKVHSPLIPEGAADVLLAFETAEALRWVHFVKPGGAVLISPKRIVPPIALFKGKGPAYPDDPVGLIRKRVPRVTEVRAEEIARGLGHPKVENTVLLGALSRFLDIPEAVWTRVIEKNVPRGTENVNAEAFRAGRGAAAG